jgi:cupin 2 domain-containing protein
MPPKKSSKPKKKKKKLRGHYCWVCGCRRANEKFSGKGHTRHICKDCAREQRVKRREMRKIAASPQVEKNFFSDLPTSQLEKLIENVFQAEHVRIERIVLTGQPSSHELWCDHPEGKWLILLRGFASLEIQGESQGQRLLFGDYIYIPPHQKHRIHSTSEKQTVVCLAVFVNQASFDPLTKD